jgi:hypothetical protein
MATCTTKIGVFSITMDAALSYLQLTILFRHSLYLPNDQLALSFGGAKSLHEITPEQIRRFSRTAGLPERLVSQTISETVERVAQAWVQLAEKEILPTNLRKLIGSHIDSTAARTKTPHQPSAPRRRTPGI